MRILLAEDDQPVASFISKGLAAEKYQVDLAADGEQAIALAEKHDYDLVILDVKLPKFDGFTVLRKIRESKPDLSVLFLTASAQVSDRVKGLDLGADDYLTKPFSLNELLARVRALSRRSSRKSEAVVKVGDLVMDRVERMVTRAGRSIQLTPKEFALLEYLMRNAGRPVSRTEIVEHVWSPALESATNVVDVYVNYLRKKVDGGESNKLIRTIRGVGYKIGAEEGEGNDEEPETPPGPASA
ncbi:MAG TPA: response regulator transcription factor [Candidatus Acidoferrales bacterium]|nr:response regulator transcription factor [Candidatus Acidoferrales bacterium]